VVINIEADRRRIPLNGENVEIVGKFRRRWKGVSAGQRAVAGVTRAMHRTVNLSRFIADALHDVDFTTPGPARSRVVITQQPEGRPHPLPLRDLDASFETPVFLLELTLRLQTP